jgi:tRNA 2-selenouridine synthase
MSDGQQTELRELIDKLRNFELPEIDIKELCSPCPSISWNDFEKTLSEILLGNPHYCILDVRSESEFAESALPRATNLPIFDDDERHNVGLLFKQQSEALAEQVGAYYAFKKQDEYLENVKKISAGRKVFVHCWRGGYRSKAVTALLVKHGIDAQRLEGGHKAYRRAVHTTLYETQINLISLSGKTGTGKSELLEHIQVHYPEVPVLHLESAARHAASVFGSSRFNQEPVENQQIFESRLYTQLLKYKNKDGSFPTFLTEKESSKIGRMLIPNGLLHELKLEKHIRINCSIENRVARLKREYIDHSTPEKIAQLKNQLECLKRLLGEETLNDYMTLFDQQNWSELLEKILVEYYDKTYKKTCAEPLFEVTYENTSDTAKAIINFLKKTNRSEHEK